MGMIFSKFFLGIDYKILFVIEIKRIIFSCLLGDAFIFSCKSTKVGVG